MKSIFLSLACCFLFFANAYAQSVPMTNKAKTIVFVHGAFGGGWDYRELEQILETKGHRVERVTLTGQGERVHLLNADINLDTHIMDVVNTFKYDELEEVILVGHSYGGMVITGVAHRIPEKIKHLVYMDAFLPMDGESVMDLLTQEQHEWVASITDEQGLSLKVNWDFPKDVPHPAKTFYQPISLNSPDAEKIPATFVLAIDKNSDNAAFRTSAERAKSRGWEVLEWVSEHNTQRTMPKEYTEFLISLD